MLVFHDGTQSGTLGGGCVEAEVKQRALRILFEAYQSSSEIPQEQGRPVRLSSRELLTFQLDHDYGWDDGLICGGRMKMLVDPVFPGDDLLH